MGQAIAVNLRRQLERGGWQCDFLLTDGDRLGLERIYVVVLLGEVCPEYG